MSKWLCQKLRHVSIFLTMDLKALIKKLEKKRSQLPKYGELMGKILIRKLSDSKFILKELSAYLEKYPEVKVLDIEERTKGLIGTDRNYRFLLTVSFKCADCKKMGEEQTNLVSGSMPHTNDGLICNPCEETYRDQAFDAESPEPDPDYDEDEELEKLEKLDKKKIPDSEIPF